MTYVTRRLAAARDLYRHASRELAFVRKVGVYDVVFVRRYECQVLAALDELWLAQQEAERALPQVRP